MGNEEFIEGGGESNPQNILRVSHNPREWAKHAPIVGGWWMGENQGREDGYGSRIDKIVAHNGSWCVSWRWDNGAIFAAV